MMKEFQKLTEKYYNGETTLEEEAVLKVFFTANDTKKAQKTLRINAFISNLCALCEKPLRTLRLKKLTFKTYSTEKTCEADFYTQLMFKAFAEEKAIQAPASAKLFSPMSLKSHKLKSWHYLATGAAACILIFFGIFLFPQKHEYQAYVIINGVRIYDEKLALQYIKESFEESERIEKLALAQIEEMNQVENELNTIANNIINQF